MGMICKRNLTWIGMMLLATSLRPASADDSKETRVGRRLATFSLQDFRGKEHSLDDYADQKILVLAFLGTECPLAKLYAPRLQRLAEQYESKQVAVLGINANRQDSLSEIASYARKHGLKFPLLKDTGNQLADALSAVRTPEVFVLDQGRTVRYWGRIDDQYGVGYVRPKPKRRDLQIAIDQLLANKKVSQPVHAAEGCFIGRIRKPAPVSDITYARQISRILQNRCVECHREGEIAPFALDQYEDVAGWAETIAEVVREERMPPWHADPSHGEFLNNRRLTKQEKELIFRWVERGAPQGDLRELPEPKTYTAGWQLPKKPDLILPLSKRSFRVPAEGVVRYQYFRVDPGFKEDKWITAAELLPGNRAVVHHILAFARGPGERGFSGGLDGFLVGYVPGLRTLPFPDGMAKRIAAGSELFFQVHYTPIGSVQIDESLIGFQFADEKDVKFEVRTTSAAQRYLRIPPGDDNYRVTAMNSRPLDNALLLGFMPHMHVRGKSFRYEAHGRDGKKEILLDVPRFDFNWQTSYRLKEPRQLAAGTRMYCTAHFDNSESNLNNPDPKKTVGWGDQTWDEMMIGYFDIAVPRRSGREEKPQPDRNRTTEGGIDSMGVIKRFDRNGNGKLEREEASGRMRLLFTFWDADRNGVLSHDEIDRGLQRLKRDR